MSGVTAFPGAIDTVLVPDNVDGSTATLAVVTTDVPTHSGLHNNQSAAILALENKLGIDSSADPSSIDYRIAAIELALGIPPPPTYLVTESGDRFVTEGGDFFVLE